MQSSDCSALSNASRNDPATTRSEDFHTFLAVMPDDNVPEPESDQQSEDWNVMGPSDRAEALNT